MTAPAYQRIADGIRRQMTSGELAVGDRLPTAAELAGQWRVSGAVVTQAAIRTVAPLDLWQLEFAHTISATDVPSPFLSRDYPGVPYPGARPGVSYVELDGVGWVAEPLGESSSGWSVHLGGSRTVDIDSWLAGQGASPVADRLPVLAYGSNASPGKLQWLRAELGLTGPVVVLEADVQDAAAVWTGGVREHDGERPAVLAAVPGAKERHSIWLATPEQRAVLDRGEGRGERYRLAWVQTPVTLTDGTHYDWVLAYLARPEVMGQDVPSHLNRSPLLVNGSVVRVAELRQAGARDLQGELAGTDGLEAIEVTGEPSAGDIAPAGD